MIDTQTVVAAFTEMASHYEQTVDRELRQFWGVPYRQFIQDLAGQAELRESERVLDVATGAAVVPLTLVQHATWRGSVIGLDITPHMLQAAKANVRHTEAKRRIRLVAGSGHELPFPAGHFDVVVCALATHHMHVPTLVNELHRVLAPGGRLLVADVATSPFWRSAFGRAFLRLMAAVYGWTQDRARMKAELEALDNMLGPEQWHALLVAAGFSDPALTVFPARRPWYPSGLIIRGAKAPREESA
jgi:ubiquinone/menaquinone biosynthesis C-methylase UbiE